MTTIERREAVTEWLKTAKAGDDVCVTNTYDATRFLGNLFNTMVPSNLQNEEIDDICMITTIRAILPDGAVVVGDKIFNEDGTLSESTPMSGHPSLHPVTDELRQLTWRYNFYKSIKNIQWESFSDDGITAIIDLINKEINDIHERQEKEQQEKEEESTKSGLTISEDTGHGVSGRSHMCDMIEPVVNHTRCDDCPNRKEHNNGSES